jgi:hypothetical protein
VADDSPSKGTRFTPYVLDLIALALILGAEETWRAGHSWHACVGELLSGLICGFIGLRWTKVISIIAAHNPWKQLRQANVRIALDYLRQHGPRVYVHTVITGGQALLDTLNGFHELAQSTGERNIVVWVNEYFGRVEAEGKKFSEMAAYRDNAEKVCGAIVFSKRNQDTFGRDVEEMIAAKLTFNEAIGTGKFPIMAKQRLKIVQRDLFDQLDRVAF